MSLLGYMTEKDNEQQNNSSSKWVHTVEGGVERQRKWHQINKHRHSDNVNNNNKQSVYMYGEKIKP